MPMEKNLKNGAAFRPDVTREAVEALLNEGLSVSAAAKRLGCSYQTARSRLESGAKKPSRSAKRGRRPMSTDEFVRRARLIHGDRYDYGQVEYVRNDRKVCIICPIHGPFQQMPFKHLSGSGCSHPECANAKRVATNMSRYGARAILQVDQFREKRQETVRSRYGVDSVMQSASVKEKWRASRKKGRGVKQKPSYQWPWDTPGSDGSRVGDGEPDDD